MERKTKVQEVCEYIVKNIKNQVYLPHHKVPSIRYLANKLNFSTFTVSQAYEQLVSLGYLKSHIGSGYFVCENHLSQEELDISPALIKNVSDTGWLMGHLFSELPANKASGSGLLPDDWLIPPEIITTAIKKSAKEAKEFIYSYGHIQGYYPLRELFSKQLDKLGINANPNLIMTMPGVSSAIQIVLRTLTQEDDYVIVDDPSWFWLLGCLHQLRLNVLSVPRDKDGPDIEIFEKLLEKYNPKIYITNSILNNPTSFNVSPSKMYKVLNLIDKYNCYLLEDDVYSSLDTDQKFLRYAALDQFNRVFYVTGVSKTLGANWRVAFLCTPNNYLEAILRQKMLSNMTSSELTERSVYRIWLDPNYLKHIENMRRRLVKKHLYLKESLEQIGIDYPEDTNNGIFIWLDIKLNTTEMAIKAYKEEYLLAPGYLFSPHRDFSNYIRINVTRINDEFIKWLEKYKIDNENKI